VTATPFDPTGTNETVIKSAGSQQGIENVGDFTAKQRYALVYITCSGAGNISLTVEPLGTYPLNCDQTGVGSRNQFEIGVGKNYSVSVNGGRGQTWAVTVAETNSEN
jgi:hypothetical protein